MFSEGYEKEKYDETFQSVYGQLKAQRDSDDTYAIEDLENCLKTLYANQGDNWSGRGGIKDIVDSATIAACEVMLTEWRDK